MCTFPLSLHFEKLFFRLYTVGSLFGPHDMVTVWGFLFFFSPPPFRKREIVGLFLREAILCPHSSLPVLYFSHPLYLRGGMWGSPFVFFLFRPTQQGGGGGPNGTVFWALPKFQNWNMAKNAGGEGRDLNTMPLCLFRGGNPGE